MSACFVGLAGFKVYEIWSIVLVFGFTLSLKCTLYVVFEHVLILKPISAVSYGH